MIILASIVSPTVAQNTFPTVGGYAGIGTTSPAYALDIVNINDYLSLRLGGSTPLLKFANPSYLTGNGAEMYQDNLGVFRFNVNSYTTGFAIQPTGRLDAPNGMFITGSLGIGTAAPGSYKLAVEGTIGARKIKVTLDNPWPDYVFHPTYRLPSLKEVEQYIQSHKHLAGIPSAVDVERDGLDIGENQVELVKKIEELTLYLIEQDKRLQALQEEIEKLKMKPVGKMKKRK
jgi:hypothetical protein